MFHGRRAFGFLLAAVFLTTGQISFALSRGRAPSISEYPSTIGMVIPTLEISKTQPDTLNLALAQCTGTRIGRDTILTAAHCVKPEVLPVLKKTGQNLIVGYRFSDKNSSRLEGENFAIIPDQILVHPRTDVALIQVSSQSPLPDFLPTAIVPLSVFQVIPGRPLEIGGYGFNEVTRKLEKNFNVNKVPKSHPLYNLIQAVGRPVGPLRMSVALNMPSDSKDPGDDFLYKSFLLKDSRKETQGFIEHGDSGGPVYLRQLDGTLLVVGVNHAGIPSSDKGLLSKLAARGIRSLSGVRGIYISLLEPDVLSWIQQNVR